MDDRMFVASELATSGSVMAKQLRIRPSSSGSSHVRCCSGVPYRSRTSMLPVSGAEQLNTSGANGERPITSQRVAYYRFVSPEPRVELGRKRLQRSTARALTFTVH